MTIEEAFKHYREHGFPHRLSPHADGEKILSLKAHAPLPVGGIDADGMARHAGDALVRRALVVVPDRKRRSGFGRV